MVLTANPPTARGHAALGFGATIASPSNAAAQYSNVAARYSDDMARKLARNRGKKADGQCESTNAEHGDDNDNDDDNDDDVEDDDEDDEDNYEDADNDDDDDDDGNGDADDGDGDGDGGDDTNDDDTITRVAASCNYGPNSKIPYVTPPSRRIQSKCEIVCP